MCIRDSVIAVTFLAPRQISSVSGLHAANAQIPTIESAIRVIDHHG